MGKSKHNWEGGGERRITGLLEVFRHILKASAWIFSYALRVIYWLHPLVKDRCLAIIINSQRLSTYLPSPSLAVWNRTTWSYSPGELDSHLVFFSPELITLSSPFPLWFMKWAHWSKLNDQNKLSQSRLKPSEIPKSCSREWKKREEGWRRRGCIPTHT